MKVKQKPQSPKTHKPPRHLSMEALGLLTLMREHTGSDGLYVWGIIKTAEYFGQDHRKVRKAYDELVREQQVETIQSGKDPVTGKNRLLIVRPWGKNPTRSNPVANLPLVVSPLEPSSGISTPHSIRGTNTVNRPVSIEISDCITVDVRGKSATGLRKALKDEQDILALWEAGKSAKSREKADQCRRRITELEAQLAGAQ
jgi:hypothetical protein